MRTRVTEKGTITSKIKQRHVVLETFVNFFSLVCFHFEKTDNLSFYQKVFKAPGVFLKGHTHLMTGSEDDGAVTLRDIAVFIPTQDTGKFEHQQVKTQQQNFDTFQMSCFGFFWKSKLFNTNKKTQTIHVQKTSCCLRETLYQDQTQGNYKATYY